MSFENFDEDSIPSISNILEHMKSEINSLDVSNFLGRNLKAQTESGDLVDIFKKDDNLIFNYYISPIDRVYLSLRPDILITLSPKLGKLFNCQKEQEFYNKNVNSHIYAYGRGVGRFQARLPQMASDKTRSLARYQDLWNVIKNAEDGQSLDKIYEKLEIFFKLNQPNPDFDLTKDTIFNLLDFNNAAYKRDSSATWIRECSYGRNCSKSGISPFESR